MTRSRKKPHINISKAWDKFKESMFRHKVKKELLNIEKEIPLNPDRDFEESLEYSKMGSWGTRLGWDVPPQESDGTWMQENFEKAKRK